MASSSCPQMPFCAPYLLGADALLLHGVVHVHGCNQGDTAAL
jgi:hypothetical protein